MSNIMRPLYDTKLFTEIWHSADEFKTDFQASAFAGCIHYGEAKPSPETGEYPDNVSLLFYLLYAKYGNNPIANFDINQFKYKIYSTIYQYGPTWEKRVDIQQKLRALSDDELRIGARAIYNTALNPSTEPTTGTLEELTYINSQNTTGYKKSKMEGYALLWEALKTDVTEQFLSRFRGCFKQFVKPEHPIVFLWDEEGEDSND